MIDDEQKAASDALIGSSLDRFVQDKVRPLGTKLSFQMGQHVYTSGDLHPYLYLVESGRFSFSRIGKSGRRGTFGIMGTGESFGLYPLLLGIPMVYHCECIEPALVVRIDSENLNSLIDRDPDVRWAVINSLSKRLKRVTLALHDERMLPLRHRLALRMCEIADPDGVLPLNQTELADFLGVSRFALSKALKDFKQAELVSVGYRRIRIIDRAGLERYGSENSDLS